MFGEMGNILKIFACVILFSLILTGCGGASPQIAESPTLAANPTAASPATATVLSPT